MGQPRRGRLRRSRRSAVRRSPRVARCWPCSWPCSALLWLGTGPRREPRPAWLCASPGPVGPVGPVRGETL